MAKLEKSGAEQNVAVRKARIESRIERINDELKRRKDDAELVVSLKDELLDREAQLRLLSKGKPA